MGWAPAAVGVVFGARFVFLNFPERCEVAPPHNRSIANIFNRRYQYLFSNSASAADSRALPEENPQPVRSLPVVCWCMSEKWLLEINCSAARSFLPSNLPTNPASSQCFLVLRVQVLGDLKQR